MSLIEIPAEQCLDLPFHKSCPVYIYERTSIDSSDENFTTTIAGKGYIEDAFFRMKQDRTSCEIVYKVKPIHQISIQIVESSLIRYMTGCKVIVSNKAFQKDPVLYSKLSQQSETLTGYILGTCEIPKDDSRYSEEDTFWYSVKIFDSILHEVSPKFLSYQSPFGKSVQDDTFPQQEEVPMAIIQTSVQESELESMATRTSVSYSNHDRNEVTSFLGKEAHEKPSLKPEIVSMHEVTNDNYYHDLFDDVKKGPVSVKTISTRISAGKDTIFHDGKSKCWCRLNTI